MLTHGALCSSLEGSNQIVSDQGVRKNLYQKVRMPVFPSFALRIESTDECFVDRRCVPRRLVILGPDLARSERDEEEIREGVDGERLNAVSPLPCPAPYLVLCMAVAAVSCSCTIVVVASCWRTTSVLRRCVLCRSVFYYLFCSVLFTPLSARLTRTLGYLVFYLTVLYVYNNVPVWLSLYSRADNGQCHVHSHRCPSYIV